MTVQRRWFRHREGGFFRNVPLIIAEMEALNAQRPLWERQRRANERQFAALEAEWSAVMNVDLIRAAELPRGDIEAIPMSIRESHPDRPGLWVLDDSDLSTRRLECYRPNGLPVRSSIDVQARP